MKKITILFSLLVATAGFSQVVLEDFEGPAPTLALANNNAGTSATIVADPAPAPVNGDVLEFITGAAGVPWQQVELTLQGDYLDLTTTKTMTVDVYSETPFDVLIRVTDGVVSSTNNTPVADSAADGIHTGSGWETVTFDFGTGETQDGQAVANGIYGRLFLFNLWDANDSGTGPGAWSCDNSGNCPSVTAYYDNITGIAGGIPETCNDGILNNGEEEIDCGGPNCTPCPSPPTVAAPTPVARAPQNVISIFSDAYNDIGVDTFDAAFCGATTNEILVDGNPTKVITGLGCEGIEFITNRFDASEFDFFHMDIFIEGPTMDKSFNFKWSNWSGLNGETNALEYSMTNASSPEVLPSTNPGEWISIDLQFSDFNGIITPPNGTDATDRSDFVQFVISSNLDVVYYDNLYLHNNNLSTDEFSTSNFKVYPNPTSNVWNVESNTIINSIAVYDILGKQVSALTPNESSVELSATNFKAGIYFAKIEGDSGTKTIKLIKE